MQPPEQADRASPDRAAPHAALAGPAPGQGRREFRFDGPRRRSPFIVLCCLLPVATAAWLTMPSCLPDVIHRPTGEAWQFLAVLLWVCVMVGLLELIPPAGLNAPRPVALCEFGVCQGRWLMLWEDITRIRKGLLRVSPFMLLGKGRPRRFALPVHPVVLGEVLPAIMRRRPAVEISKRARRAMDCPEAVTSIARWTGLGFLAAAAIMAAVPVLARHGNALSFIYVLVSLVVIYFAMVPGLALPRTLEQRFACTMACGFAVVSPILMSVFFALLLGAPIYAVDVLATMYAVLFVAAGVVAFRWMKLTAVTKTAIVACAVLLPLAVRQYGVSRLLSHRDITDLVGGKSGYGSLLWSQDGVLAAAPFAEGDKGERQLVADFAAGRSVALPLHEGLQWIRWLDRSCACRLLKEDGQKVLYVFRFADRREVRLSPVAHPQLWWVRHVSPDGRMLCWLGLGDDDETVLKTYDLHKDVIEDVEVEWPDDDDIGWLDCGWADGATLAVYGLDGASADRTQPPAPRALHVLWIDRSAGTTAHTVTSERFGKWAVSPDCRHAFAGFPMAGPRSRVCYHDLRTGQAVPIGGESLPAWDATGRCAVRVSRFHGRAEWLCRFDVETRAETPVLRLSDEERLLAVSSGARFALVGGRDLRCMRPSVLVNVPSGQRRAVNGSTSFATSILLFDESWRCRPPWLSLFSPDGRRFIAPRYSRQRGVRLLLYNVPEDWVGEGGG